MQFSKAATRTAAAVHLKRCQVVVQLVPQVGVFARQFQSLAQMISIFIAVKAGSFGCDLKEDSHRRFEIDRFKIISILYSGDMVPGL